MHAAGKITWTGVAPWCRQPSFWRWRRGRREGGGSDTGEAHATPPRDGKDDEVKGRCVYAGDTAWGGRGGDPEGRSHSSLGGEGEGDEQGDGQSSRENVPLKGGGGEEEAWGRAVPSDDVMMMSSPSHEEVNLSGNVVEVEQNVENDGEKGGDDVMHNSDVLRGTQDPEDSATHSSPRARCVGSPVITCDALLVISVADSIATETDLGLVIDDLHGGEGRHGAGKVIGDTPHKIADHACETLMPAPITQGPFEGDNDAGPFSVIDPAICSQAGRQDGEKSGSSQSAAGVGLSPPVKWRWPAARRRVPFQSILMAGGRRTTQKRVHPPGVQTTTAADCGSKERKTIHVDQPPKSCVFPSLLTTHLTRHIIARPAMSRCIRVRLVPLMVHVSCLNTSPLQRKKKNQTWSQREHFGSTRTPPTGPRLAQTT